MRLEQSSSKRFDMLKMWNEWMKIGYLINSQMIYLWFKTEASFFFYFPIFHFDIPVHPFTERHPTHKKNAICHCVCCERANDRAYQNRAGVIPAHKVVDICSEVKFLVFIKWSFFTSVHFFSFSLSRLAIRNQQRWRQLHKFTVATSCGRQNQSQIKHFMILTDPFQ